MEPRLVDASQAAGTREMAGNEGAVPVGGTREMSGNKWQAPLE